MLPTSHRPNESWERVDFGKLVRGNAVKPGGLSGLADLSAAIPRTTPTDTGRDGDYDARPKFRNGSDYMKRQPPHNRIPGKKQKIY